ncbi:MAG: hypothetical protein ACRDZ8_06245 [Acidimicrobiales bacterium]
MSVAAQTLALVIALGLVVVLPMSAVRSANSFSSEAWNGVGRSRFRWVTAFSLLPLLIGPAAAVVYFVRVRPQLAPLGSIPTIRRETSARIRRGPHQGQVGRAFPGRGLHRPIFALTGYAWFRFSESGKRVGVSRDMLEPIDTST